MIITAYQICSVSNKLGKEEPIAMVLDIKRANTLARQAFNGELNLLTAKSPFIIKIVEIDYNPSESN